MAKILKKNFKSPKRESKPHAFIKKYFMLIVVFAIMLIPSIYTVLFLGSMWDPYGNTGNLPVAIVNEDKPIVYDGRVVNIGEQLCNKLEKNESLKFNFVDERTALHGLENATYYMVMVIPDDFSANSVTLTSPSPEKMQLEYYVNPGTNYIASKFGESAVKTIKEQINKTVINTYATTVYSKLGTIHDGFVAAADGSGQIGGGMVQLKNGNTKLTAGIKTLSKGCLTLKEGTGTLEDGLKQYTGGVTQVADGVTQLSDGVGQLKDGTNQLSNGVGQLKDGTTQLVDNNQKLNDGADQLLGGLNTMSDQIGESLTPENLKDLERLENGLIEINDGIQTLQKAINEDYKISDDKLATIKKDLDEANEIIKTDGFKTLCRVVSYTNIDFNKTLQRIEEMEQFASEDEKQTLEQLKQLVITVQRVQHLRTLVTPENAQKLVDTGYKLLDAYGQLTDGVQRLSDGGNEALPVASDTLKKLSGGLMNVKSGLDRTVATDGETGLIEGMTTLKGGLKTYTGGVEQVDGGLTQVGDGLTQLGSGVTKFGDGISQLDSGVKKLTANNAKINGGAAQLDDGAGKLYDGSLKLLDGSNQIGDGCNKLLAGARTLETSLRDGAKQIEDTNTSDESAEMFSQPVDAKETFQRTINSNGEAMSAYMMCAGLWVACLAFCLMFSPFNTSLKGRKTFLQHAAIAGFVAVIAPMIMVSLLSAINGLRPAHPIETYAVAILASLAFMSIVYMLNTMFDSIGSFTLLILLCLQLSGAAGTYPIELSPKFYQIIHPFMPFTYGVDAFRSTLSTGNSLMLDIAVFSGIIVVCGLLTLLTYDLRQIKLRKKSQFEEQRKLQQQAEAEA
ncbi:MAG: YhgE/Pip domain-containing protein [Eubacterium sp.]|nr:YhgE/Pip domain-containing protein [Eubacterium sp.]